jgi:hypothetical protein
MRRWNLVVKIIAGLSLAVLLGLALFTPGQALAQATSTPAFDPLAAGAKYDVDVVYGSCETWNISCYFLVAIKRFTIAILLLFGKFYAILLNIAAVAVRILIENGMSLASLPIVTAGFKLTQGLTNLIFVLAIIIMAFATIFQVEDYSAKRLMVNLIKGAVLVNFSFLIAGAFIDVSNVFTNYFLRDVTADTLGSAFNPQSLLTPADPSKFGIVSTRTNKAYRCSPGTPSERIVYTNNPANDCPGETAVEIRNSGNVTSGIETVSIGSSPDGAIKYRFNINEDANGWATWFKLLQALLLADLMTLILMIVMIALAIMILARNVTLMVLLIFMPLTWGLRVIPKLSEQADKWWDKFFKSIIFLPTVTFLIFLAVTTTRVLATSGGLFGSQVVENILQMLVLCGILMAAIKAGKGAGVAGAALAFGVGGFIARGALGVQKTALGVGTQVVGAALEGKGKYNPLKYAKLGIVGRGVSKAGSWIGKAGNESLTAGKFQTPKIDPNKGIGWISGLGEKGDKTSKLQQAASKHRSEHLKDLGTDELIKEVGHPHSGNGVAEQLAMLQQLADKKALGSDKITDERMLELLEAAKKAGATEAYSSAKKEMMLSRPKMMAALSRTDDKFMKDNNLTAQSSDDDVVLAQIRTMKNEDLAKIRFDKMSAPAQKELAEKYAKNRTILGKRLPDAGDEETKAMLTAFDQQVADIGTLLNTAATGGGGTGGKKNWNEVLKNYGLADARTELENQLKALRASRGVAGANTAEIDKQVGLIQDLSRSVEAWHRTNQSPGSVV